MASWKEIERVRKDLDTAKQIAARLFKFHSDFTDWEKDFLESMATRADEHELTTRQAEKLLEIRDGCEELVESRGYSVKLLIKQIFEARFDLTESDEDWIEKMREQNQTAVKRKHIGRLMRCARQLFIVDEELAV